MVVSCAWKTHLLHALAKSFFFRTVSSPASPILRRSPRGLSARHPTRTGGFLACRSGGLSTYHAPPPFHPSASSENTQIEKQRISVPYLRKSPPLHPNTPFGKSRKTERKCKNRQFS